MFKETEWDTLVSTLERFGIPYSVHKVVPFIGELVPTAEPVSSKVICFGSYSMRHAAKANNWTPGVYDLFDQNFEIQLKHWGDKMLNADALVVPFKDAVLTEATFVRPIDDSKYFAGKVFDAEDFNTWRHGICEMKEDYGNSLTGDTKVMLCTQKEIYAEYRYWVVNGKIVTKSRYKLGTRVTYSSEVDKRFDYFVGYAINTWCPHHAFVIDVADTPNGIKIVEINTINSAGFYAGDVQAIVMALEASPST